MDQRQRRKGVVDNLNSAINTAQNIQRATKIGRAVTGAAEIASTSQIWIPAAIVIAVILIIVFIILLGGGTGAALELGKQPNPGGPGSGSGNGNISSCRFTRSGTQSPIKSSILTGWITDAANKASIPPAVLSSVAMHENPGFLMSVDNNDTRISSNQFCNEGSIFCEQSGKKLYDGSCSPSDLATGARDARAVGLMQIIDVYHPGENLCSITQSLAIAAEKLKTDGVSSQPTRDDINRAINAYHGSCNYGSYSYCDEVWQDYQNCQASPITTSGILGWAGQITNNLQIGSDGGLNRMTTSITNNSYTAIYAPSTSSLDKYWCTYLVIDSYNLAGYRGLSLGSGDGAVYYMISHWKQLPGYTFLDYYNQPHENILKLVRPGYAIFFLNDPSATGPSSDGDHAAIVKSISIDLQGNGVIETYDSNLPSAWGTVVRYPVVDWEINGTLRGPAHPNYSVMGFGFAR
ncbi:hypothetical protein M1146_02680 [Patescibacteria group bacterium]|nr:hypothetical protein [Patescibacteria group bacterium]